MLNTTVKSSDYIDIKTNDLNEKQLIICEIKGKRNCNNLFYSCTVVWQKEGGHSIRHSGPPVDGEAR